MSPRARTASAKRPAVTSRLLAMAAVVAVACSGCGELDPPWRDQTLASGKHVQVTSVILAWGAEHAERFPDQDCFLLEFVAAQPDAAVAAREAEAREVFELIRPVSEQWGFRTATVIGRRSPKRDRNYEYFIFKRAADGKWSGALADLGRK